MQAILSAKMCNLCCDYNSTLEIDCPKCHNVFYCSLKHLKEDEKNHLEICREFKISFETDLHDYREIEIFDIEKQKKRSQSFPTDLQAMINLLSKPESRSLISYAPFTWVATIINVMRKTIGIFDHQHRTNLVIDIVGTEAEVCHFNENCIKVIFHLFKMLQKIRFNFCGPNLEVISYMNRQYSFDGKRVEFTFDQRVYEECGSCSTPDIIISFNCGFHEIQNCFNPWYKAILKMILYKNVPVVFTSYTFKESKKDLDVVLSIAKNVKSTIEIVSLNEKNPFRNPYPLKNVYRFLEVAEQNESIEAFYYINNYICIFYSPGNDIPTN